LSRAAPAGRRAAVRFSAVDARRDDELGPLHPTVQWLPPLGSEGPDEGSAEGSITLPIFPLGSVCYLPFTSHGLNIFEPRYRALYNDILFNGSRRFVVTMVDPLTGRLAKTGVVFYLDELKEVSEQTGDSVKFVCQHSVIGCVEIERVLNPQVWRTRETYLKARVRQRTEPCEPDAPPCPLETEVAAAMERVVALQAETNEMPRFTRGMLKALNVSRAPGGEALWRTVGLWHALQEQRVLSVQAQMQADISKRVVDHLKAKGKAIEGGQVRLEDLPPDVRADLARIQEGYRAQLEELAHAPYGEPFQLLLQADGHEERLALFLEMVNGEAERLARRASLQKLFDKS